MVKILITGAGGYIGSVATDLFLKAGYQVVGIDNFATGYKQPIELLEKKYGKEKFKFYEADLKQNLSSIFEKETGISALIHYAASCVVDESMKNPFKYFDNNVSGTANLLSTMDKFGIKNIIFSSTCAVYGESQYFPIDEKHPLNPTTPYGASKKMAEEVIAWYGKLKKFNSYTTLEAKQLRETKLSAFLKLIFIPLYVFLRWMIYHHGYRDGWTGLLAGLMRAYYEVLLYSKFIFS